MFVGSPSHVKTFCSLVTIPKGSSFSKFKNFAMFLWKTSRYHALIDQAPFTSEHLRRNPSTRRSSNKLTKTLHQDYLHRIANFRSVRVF